MSEQREGRSATKPKARRGPRKATAKYLRNSALYYLDRYAASAAHLRRLLTLKVERSAGAHGTDPAAGRSAVDGLIAEFLDNGLLDDVRYARERTRSLHRRGASARAIRSRLAAKGVDREVIDEALSRLRDEAAEPELAAALTLARKRRLGPYRPAGTRAQERERDLARLGRQGFGYDTARRVIDAEDPMELEEEARISSGARS
jgi:regulatory protein